MHYDTSISGHFQIRDVMQWLLSECTWHWAKKQIAKLRSRAVRPRRDYSVNIEIPTESPKQTQQATHKTQAWIKIV